MWTLFFFVTTLLCAEKWFVARVAEMALLHYIQDKDFPWPSAKEFDEYCDRAWRALLRLP